VDAATAADNGIQNDDDKNNNIQPIHDDDDNNNSQKKDDKGHYWIGTGIHDITGPAAEVNMMGYGQADQTTHGIHQRLWARAFVIGSSSSTPRQNQPPPTVPEQEMIERLEEEEEEEEARIIVEPNNNNNRKNDNDDGSSWTDWLLWPLRWMTSSSTDGTSTNNNNDNDDDNPTTPDPESSICFVSIDLCMVSDVLHGRVLQRLDELLLSDSSTFKMPNLCRDQNDGSSSGSLSISATHTHSAPAGFLQYALYQIQSLGYVAQVVDLLVEGIAQALYKAHRELRPGGRLYLHQGSLREANINRSPTSYLLNPPEERDGYEEEGDTDKVFLQLLLEQQQQQGDGGSTVTTDNDSTLVGLINWFAVHPTSMNSTNQLISGDNKGYASYLMEQKYNPPGTLVGQDDHKFVAAFASTNLGDVSPNTAGPRCLDSGLPCDPVTSTCHGLNELCVAFGPGRDMFESTQIIGRKQFDKAVELVDEVVAHKTKHRVPAGRVASRHSFIDMRQLNVTLPASNGTVVQTCPAAIGYGFAAGTIDGHGAFNFKQGSNSSNPFWNMVGGFLSNPSKKQMACQSPKPILLNTGFIRMPYAWDPNTVPISIFQISHLFILNVPGEFTTMAGRRLRNAMLKILREEGGYDNAKVTIAGISNTYTHYITTFEEYQGQRYEAASTLYGPYTLDAYLQEFGRILRDLLSDRPSEMVPPPKDSVHKQISLLPPVEVDAIAVGKKFGSVVENTKDSYDNGGSETAKVLFRSANPRTNPRTQDTFLTVEHLDDKGKWHVYMTDADWDTKYIWKGGVTYLGMSFAEIHWNIAQGTPQGIYRLCHAGTRRTLLGHVGEFLYQAPDFGQLSYGVNLLVATARALYRQFQWARNLLHRKHIHHLRDFEGCSSSFLVYEA